MTTTATPTATPTPGTVKDVQGAPCPKANEGSYPLYAICANCDTRIRVADGTADWVHVSDYRAVCSK